MNRPGYRYTQYYSVTYARKLIALTAFVALIIGIVIGAALVTLYGGCA